MILITDKIHAKQIITTSRQTGVTLPKPVTDSHERAERMAEGVRNIASREGDLADAVAAALDKGNDPAADKAVQRILTASSLANPGVMQRVDGVAFDQFRAVCTEHADTIIQAWTEPFDQAAATLVNAHERIGDVPLEDTAGIVARGGDIAEVWGQAQTAIRTINTVTAGWGALAELTRLVHRNPEQSVLVFAPVDWQTWSDGSLRGPSINPWQAMTSGLTLQLPDFTEYKQRVDDLDAGRRAIEQERPVDGARSHIAGREIRVPA